MTTSPTAWTTRGGGEYAATLPGGNFTFEMEREDMAFPEICDLAVRNNAKRRFLFVSKVLGRHIPVRPAELRKVSARLAGKLHAAMKPEPVVFIGMAEIWNFNENRLGFAASQGVKAGSVNLGSQAAPWFSGQHRALVPFSFSDNSINGGLTTNGFLDMEAFAIAGTKAEVHIHRLIFDDAIPTAPTGVSLGTTYPTFGVSAVPEPGSNLALLALGAGGLTLRRRLKRAA